MSLRRAFAALAFAAWACATSACSAAPPDDGPAGALGASTTAPIIGPTTVALSPASAASSAAGTSAGGATPSGSATPAERPARWAAPLSRPGLPNLHRVTDGYLRGAQPSAEGMRELAKLGVRTVVNLRAFHSDRSLLAGQSLAYETIAFKTWHAEDEDVVKFLRIVTDPARLPVFVHCQHGADRTGMLTAVYRIAVEGWTKDEAIAEMTEGGFGFHPVWTNLVAYVRALDVEAVARAAGLRSDAGTP